MRLSESLDFFLVPETEKRNNKFAVLLSTRYRVLSTCPNHGNMTKNTSFKLIL